MLWIIQSLLGIFSTLLIPLLLLCIIQYWVCKSNYKFGLIIPIICVIYLFIKEIMYFQGIWGITDLNPNLVPYGILLIIPYGSLSLTTFLIYWFLKKKNK